MIEKSGIWQPVKFQLVSRLTHVELNKIRNDFFLSYLLINVGKLIQRYDKIISFFIHFKNERLTEILQAVRCRIL